jgi:hypothetical protein
MEEYEHLRRVAGAWRRKSRCSQWVFDEILQEAALAAELYRRRTGNMVPISTCFHFARKSFYQKKFSVVNRSYEYQSKRLSCTEELHEFYPDDFDDFATESFDGESNRKLDIEAALAKIKTKKGEQYHQVASMIANEKSMTEIANAIGVSRQRVYRILSVVIKMLEKR